MLKNEFGDVAVDSELASAQAISGVQELLNGCICCNLVGQLSDALDTLRKDVSPDRIVIETSGSAFPATLAMEVNRLIKETGQYLLDGIVSVIDVENWKGYEDTSYTAKVQAQYNDLIVLNKWELVDERRLEDVEDRILDLGLDPPTPRTKSSKGWVDKNLIFGLDAGLSKDLSLKGHHGHDHDHMDVDDHAHEHQSEVEVLNISLASPGLRLIGVDTKKLDKLLSAAAKDEVYRIKAVMYCSDPSQASAEEAAPEIRNVKRLRPAEPSKHILNWAFGRWTYTALNGDSSQSTPLGSGTVTPVGQGSETVLRMTIVTARYEANKWKKRIESGNFIALEDEAQGILSIERTA